MSIYKSTIWRADLDIMMRELPELEDLANNSVMVTGCTGLICSAVVDIFIRWNETHEKKIKILAAGRNRQKAANRFSPHDKEEWLNFVPYDALSTQNELSLPSDFIIHGAGNASPNKIMREPVETMMSNIAGIKHLLDYAKEKGTKRVLYISSSEVYGKTNEDRPHKADEYGYIDILDARSSYSIGKCAAETLCASFFSEYGVESVIVRPGHIYGPTASPYDIRVSSAWAYSAARGEDIVMKSDGGQLRSYCYCLDCATAILKVLLCGKNIHAYNISNPDSIISIKEMGQLLAKAAGVKLVQKAATIQEKKGFNPMNNSSLDSTELLELGWRGMFGAEAGLKNTVRIIAEML